MPFTTNFNKDCINSFPVTAHAVMRMSQRHITEQAMQAALVYGRKFHIRGATVYAVGRKEIEHYKIEDVDLAEYDGVQVVCSSEGIVITTYRNRDFSGLRPRRKSARSRRQMH